MKIALRNTVLLLFVAGLAYLVLNAPSPHSEWLESHLGELRKLQALYHDHPAAALLLFASAHVFCATFAVPGSCTALNITSGAVFGFRTGCAVVYPVTIISGTLGYLAASRLRHTRMFHRYEPALANLEAGLAKGGFLFLISLRLSPFLPYGVLNPALGLLRVPFPAFLTSTFVGIFFDVVLLNSIGAALAAAGGESAFDPRMLFLGFLGLLGLAAAARLAASRFLPGGAK